MQTASQPLVLTINSALAGRNDDIGSATALPGNITARASISPYTDPEGDPSSSPDVDVYQITASAGSIVEVRICARSLTDPRCTLATLSPLDSVIEIVDVNNVRFQTCNDVGDDAPPPPVTPDPTPGAFDDACINDDINLGVVQDSKLEFQVPAGTTTFFVRVLDFRGERPPRFCSTTSSSPAPTSLPPWFVIWWGRHSCLPPPAPPKAGLVAGRPTP